MDFSSVSPDIIIFAVVIGSLLFGLFLGHSRIKTLALSVYVGIVLATELGPAAHNLATQNNFNQLSLGGIKLLLLALPILLLVIGHRERHLKGYQHPNGIFSTVILAVLTAALILSSGLAQLDPDVLRTILDESFLAYHVYNLRVWWLIAVPVGAVLKSLIPQRRTHH